MAANPSIIPFLWFDGNAEEAVDLYTSVFRDSEVLTVTRYGDAGPGPPGSVLTIEFVLRGQRFVALNGGPQYRFTEAVSFQILCDTQEEMDGYWARLSDGGSEAPCGWLKDRFGLSWQVVPRALPKLLQDPDPERARRVTEALLTMEKIDLEALESAHRGDVG